MKFFKTVSAISTPLGEGGIAIVRMSGDKAIDIADRIFVGKNNKKLKDAKTHTLQFGYIKDENNHTVDQVLVAVMRGPNTYTKEDVVEINCHGGAFVTRKILELTFKNGAEPALAGEFTKRAFLNGRIDLCEAEAVIDLINSNSSLSHNTSVNQLEGKLSKSINSLRERLVSLSAHLYAVLDFPEEGLEPLSDEEFLKILKEVKHGTEKLLKTADAGAIIRDGIKTVIAGKPNVGKSSLLNLLAGEERAIVTDIAGTTRDAIEEHINLDGVILKITDTAGIRSTDDVVENLGVVRTKKLIENASLVIFMLDAKSSPDENDYEIKKLIENKKSIVLINKSEDGINKELENVYKDFENIIEFSVKEKIGLDTFSKTVRELFDMGGLDPEKDSIINLRHKDALFKALESVNSAIEAIEFNMPIDVTFVDIQNAISYLGEVTGQTVGEEIVGEIFSKFCVGK